MNPSTTKVGHALTLDGQSNAPDVNLVLKTAQYYRLKDAQAQSIFDDIKAELSHWKDVAHKHGLSSSEIERMTAVIQA